MYGSGCYEETTENIGETTTENFLKRLKEGDSLFGRTTTTDEMSDMTGMLKPMAYDDRERTTEEIVGNIWLLMMIV